MAHMVNLVDPNVWDNGRPCSKESCLWQWKTWPLHNLKIHYNMAPFVKVGIYLSFKGLNLDIMFICNKQHLTHLKVTFDYVILCLKMIFIFWGSVIKWL
jgi:hypothetical protein